ncbi:hypothetical protein C8R45DRAFT_1130772 [Mycena sanguinolenta]|nr:hypothetical protein C8R45DRAFT_1130772 [Mycena sanguinolenta]
MPRRGHTELSQCVRSIDQLFLLFSVPRVHYVSAERPSTRFQSGTVVLDHAVSGMRRAASDYPALTPTLPQSTSFFWISAVSFSRLRDFVRVPALHMDRSCASVRERGKSTGSPADDVRGRTCAFEMVRVLLRRHIAERVIPRMKGEDALTTKIYPLQESRASPVAAPRVWVLFLGGTGTYDGPCALPTVDESGDGYESTFPMGGWCAKDSRVTDSSHTHAHPPHPGASGFDFDGVVGPSRWAGHALS